MRRLSIVLLLLVLLPLRGWAAGSMAAGPGAGLAHEAMQGAAMPCHVLFDEGQGGHAAGEEPPVAPAAEAGHLCAACDLCHAPAGLGADALRLPRPLPAAGPLAWNPRDTGRLMVGWLDRPPRL